MLSIRARVLAATLGLVLLGLVASAGAIYGALEWVLVSRLNQQLASLEPPVVAAMNQPELVADRQLDTLIPPGGFVMLVDKTGTPRYSFSQTMGVQVPSPALPTPLPTGQTILDVASKSGGPGFRVDVVPVHIVAIGLSGPGPEQRGQVVIGLSLRDTDATLSYLVLIEGLVGAATLGAVGATGFWIVRLGLRPLDRMAATASRITAGDLTLRVDDADTRSEIGRLGAALNVMLARIEEAFRQRAASEERLRRFVADASHELRTPLTSVRGYAELFRRGADKRPEDLAMAMRRIEDEASRMSRLVDEMLLLARLDQRRPLRREQVDLSAIAAEAVDACWAADPDRKVELRAPEPVIVTGDPERLRQVLDNLLANVRIHTPPRTPATVTVRHLAAAPAIEPDRSAPSGAFGATSPARGEGLAMVEVADDGPGIERDAGSKVFERFYRLDPGRSRGRGGHGLGLSIVAAIVDAHGGRCELYSEPGKGATFRLIVPLSGALPAAPIPGVAAGRTLLE
jgi:two-component system OmpR family sensor kinase